MAFYLDRLTVKDLRDFCSKHNKSDEDCNACPLALGTAECLGLIHDYIEDDETAEASAKKVYEDMFSSYYDRYVSMGGNVSLNDLMERGVCPRTIYEGNLYDSACLRSTDKFHAHPCATCEVCWTDKSHR